MHAASVDPRDTRWEEPSPVYRVYFWDRGSSYEWRLTGATDVHEVLARATGPAGRGRAFELFVETSTGQGPGLIHLAGQDLGDARVG
ncbi:hypothetical protein [Blastococcus goldschmidtiae]|uniref:Uncharacterized protein n=1 Tax=Blastococcus goldschmidtiae TaxID=3075546 RepID=A0ABU2K877_9ACTN|nr:hypothetical protein [Blastococcus sp. DSM 46792]MDT0276394.1 hypothetical protein [Blastococcus sp. DSM 46792]